MTLLLGKTQPGISTEIQHVKSQTHGYKEKIQQIPISQKLYVYSAYLDSRGSGQAILRVIGIWLKLAFTYFSITNKPSSNPYTGMSKMQTYKIWCNIYFSENFSTKITVSGRIQKINENWDLPYSACFIICEIPSNVTRIPKPTTACVDANVRHFREESK